MSGSTVSTRSRALLEIISIDPEKREFVVVLPGWRPETEVALPLSLIPEELLPSALVVGTSTGERQVFYMFCEADLAAETPDQLAMSDFERADQPEPGEALD